MADDTTEIPVWGDELKYLINTAGTESPSWQDITHLLSWEDEGDEQAYHPQNEVDGALSLSHDVSSVAGRGPSRRGPARAGRPRGMFAAAPLPCGGGHHGSAFIRAQICA